MLKLYYAPGACSMASHVALEESGLPFEMQPVALAKGEQRTEAYRKINPRGRVPALQIDGGTVLTENVAILTYIARIAPGKQLLPTLPAAEARCLSLMGFLASSVHVAFAHIGRPERYASDTAAHPNLKETGRNAFHEYLKELDGLLQGREWYADHYTVCDPYLMVFYLWGRRIELPVGDLKAYSAHAARMSARPAVQRALGQEGIALAA